MRRVSLVLLLALWAGAAQADPFSIASARYEAPTERYPHGALGDPIEWGALVLQSETGAVRRLTLPESAVFEDTAPRLFDVDRDGMMEVIAVESDTKRGARLVIYGPSGMIAATPHIGTRFRWLAPLGAADLDGDGWIEIAYIDRPHLAKVLRVWRFENGVLHPVAEASGLTNHQFGADIIEGGIRTCGGRTEMITADANWQQIVATRLVDGVLTHRSLGAYSPVSLAAALSC